MSKKTNSRKKYHSGIPQNSTLKPDYRNRTFKEANNKKVMFVRVH